MRGCAPAVLRTHGPIPSVTSGAERDQIQCSEQFGRIGRTGSPDRDTSTGRPARLMRRCDGPGVHT